jgi:hypothetical protein
MSSSSSPSRTRGHPLQPPHPEVSSQPPAPVPRFPGRAAQMPAIVHPALPDPQYLCHMASA